MHATSDARIETREGHGSNGPSWVLAVTTLALIAILLGLFMYLFREEVRIDIASQSRSMQEGVESISSTVAKEGGETRKSVESLRREVEQAIAAEGIKTREALLEEKRDLVLLLEKAARDIREGFVETGKLIGEDGIKTRNILGDSEQVRAESAKALSALESKITSEIRTSHRDTVEALTPAAPPPPSPAPQKTTAQNLEGLLRLTRGAVGSGPPVAGRYDVKELLPAERGERFCYDDVVSGRVRLSNGPGIKVRNYFSLFGREYIELDVPETGEFPVSKGATHVRFYSPTESFMVFTRR